MPETISPPGTWTASRLPRLLKSQQRAALVAVGLLAFAGLWTLAPFLPALGWAGIFAISLWPWYERCRVRWPRHGRILLPALVTALVLLAFVLPLIVVLDAVAQDSAKVLAWLAASSAQGVPAPEVLHRLPYGEQLVALWQEQIGQPGALSHFSLLHGGTTWLRIDWSGRFVGAVLHRLLLAGLMLMALFFMLRDGDTISQGIHIGARRAFGPAGARVGNQIVQAIRGTVNGLVVVGFGEGILLGVVYVVAGVPHPALLGLLTALLSAIPFGAVVAFVAAAALVFADGQSGAAVAILLIGGIVVFVADHFIRPVMIGGSTRLPFLWVLLGILAGIEAWGLIGIVAGPALLAVLLLLWREWIGAQEGPLNPRSEEG